MKDNELNDLVEITAVVCGTEAAMIMLEDGDTPGIQFKAGAATEMHSHNFWFCSYVTRQRETIAIPDILLDHRFKNTIIANKGRTFRFFAGVPLTTSGNHTLGSLCIADTVPREPSAEMYRKLSLLAAKAVRLLECRAENRYLKEKELKLSSSEAMLRSFFESSESCHLLIDKNLRLIDYNRSAGTFIKDMYGIMIRSGILVTDYMNKAYIPDFLRNYETALAGERLQIERKLHYTNGAEIWWQFSFEPAFNREGEIAAVSYTAANINSRKQQEEKILQQNQRLRNIARLQSHELRRPVASILGLMNLIREEEYRDCKEYLQMMETAVRELDDKIRYVVEQTEI